MQATPSQPLRYKHRSYSQVRQLRTCGYQFKLERIDRVPSRPSTAATAGSAIHVGTEIVDDVLIRGAWTGAHRDEIIEEALPPTLKAFEAERDELEEAGWPTNTWIKYGRGSGQNYEWYQATGIPNSIKAYVDWRVDNPDFELVDVPGFGPAIEVPFNYYPDDTQLISGSIDRIFTSKTIGGYYPLDIKSGRRPETDEQLGLYGAALNKVFGWNIIWGYYLYNLKNGEAKLTRPLTVNHWTDEKLGEVYLPATKLIDLGIYIPTPGDACMHCGVSDACPFARSVV